MRASIWKQGRAASTVATGQLCCRHPQQARTRAVHGLLLADGFGTKLELLPLPFSQLPQSSVCSLSCGGTLRHVIFEAGLVHFHAAFSPTLSPAYTSTVQKGCLVLTRTMKTGQEIPRMNAVCHSTEITLAGTRRYLKVCSFTAGF